MDGLVVGNLRLVLKIAHEFKGRGIEFADLVGAGNVGLVIAAQRYDPSRGVPFAAYAALWIKQSIVDALYRDRLVSIARSTAKWRRKEKGEEIRFPQSVSLNVLYPAPDRSLEDAVERQDLSEKIERLLSNIGSRNAGIVRPYFGLEDGEGKTLEEIGQRMGLTRERVRQIVRDSLEKLRQVATEHGLTLESFI